MDLTFPTVLAVAVIALLAPLIVQLAPALRLPAVALAVGVGAIVALIGQDVSLTSSALLPRPRSSPPACCRS